MVNCGVSPKYFLDEMSLFEVDSCLEEHFSNYKNQWEQIRMICFYIANSVSVKPINIEEIIPFSWEKEKIQTPSKLDKESVNEILLLGEHFINQLPTNNGYK